MLLRALLDNESIGIALMRGRDLEFIYANPAFVRLAQIGSLVGLTAADAWPGDSSDAVARLTAVIETGEPWVLTAQGSSFSDGGEIRRHHNFESHRLSTPDGDHVVTYVTDCTDETAAQRALEQAQLSVDTVLDRMADSFFALDLDWRFTYVNHEAERVLRTAREDLLGVSIWELFSEARGTQFETGYREAMESQKCVAFEEFYAPLATWFDVRAYPDAEGLSVFFVEANEKHALRLAREASERRFRAAFEQAAVGIAHIGLDGQFLRVNQKYAEITRRSQDELLGLRYEEILRPASPRSFAEKAEELLSGQDETYSADERYSLGNGVSIWVRLTMSVVHDDKGAPEYFMAVVEDIDERKRLERRLEAELKTSSLLLDAARALSSSTSLLDVLATLARVVADSTAHSRVSILLWHEDDAVLELVAAVGEAAAPAGTRHPFSAMTEGVQRVVLSGRMEIVDFASDEGDAADDLAMRAMRLGAVVPLTGRGRVLGVVMVDEPGEDRRFSSRECALLEAIASEALVAVENARLYEMEHRISETLQETLLVIPDAVAGVDFARLYRSATESTKVGGDFIDIFETVPGRVVVVLGDVAGKGIHAASITGMVRNTLRAHLLDGATALEAVTKTNKLVYRFTPAEIFVTLVLATIDTDTGRLCYVSAGHPAALVRGADGSVRVLSENSSVLGAFEDAVFSEARDELRAGEVLLMFSDGVTEARREQTLFGEQRVKAFLAGAGGSPQHIVDALYEALQEYTQSELRDDVAVLAVMKADEQQPSSDEEV